MRKLVCSHLYTVLAALALLNNAAQAQTQTAENPLRNVYFGDLHLHTMLSFDAFTLGTRTTPDDAYRYAKGEATEYLGKTIQRKAPLDFLGVTDHSEYLGVIRMLADPKSPLAGSTWAAGVTNPDPKEQFATIRQLAKPLFGQGAPIPEFIDEKILRSNWQIVIDAAEHHYQPGAFTTFIGYEWSAIPDYQNLHRNVIFRSAKVPP